MSAPPPTRGGRAQPTEHLPTHQPTYVQPEGRGSIRRWLMAVAMLAVLTVVVTVAINMIGSNPRDQQVPDVSGLLQADALVALQNRGFKTQILQRPDSTVPPEHVISTTPDANTAVAAGDEITINVSTGPEQREVPDCSGGTYPECVNKLKDAGFERFKRTDSGNMTVPKDRVITTIPSPNQTSAITNEITVVVSSGPDTKVVPECVGQTADVCKQILAASGFTNSIPVPVDSTEPEGQVVGTNPRGGETVAVDTVIQIQVSRANQFLVPDLRGGFWTDIEPLLRNSYGWTGDLIKLPNAQNSGVPTNGVVTQSPSAGTALKFTDPITLSFAQ
jgi:serine/threonine-protein kinase